MRNATILAAARTTHFKIVAIYLLTSSVAVMIAIVTHTGPTEGVHVAGHTLSLALKIGRPDVTSRSDTGAIR